jgi:hypothetical protein
MVGGDATLHLIRKNVGRQKPLSIAAPLTFAGRTADDALDEPGAQLASREDLVDERRSLRRDRRGVAPLELVEAELPLESQERAPGRLHLERAPITQRREAQQVLYLS